MAKLAHDVSEMQIAVLGPILADYGIDTNEFPPALVAAAVQGLALVVVQDEVRGFDTAHREAVEAMAAARGPARAAAYSQKCATPCERL